MRIFKWPQKFLRFALVALLFLFSILKLLPEYGAGIWRTNIRALYAIRGGYSSQDDDLLDHDISQSIAAEVDFCAQHFGQKYLESFRLNSAEYCTEASASNLTCYHTKTTNGRVDSLCIAKGARFIAGERVYQLACTLKEWDAEMQALGVLSFDQLPSYWYDTGPQVVFERYVTLNSPDDKANELRFNPETYSILIQREGGLNLWHSMMEVISLFMTLEVLSMARKSVTGGAMLTQEDFPVTQVVIVDSAPEGPVFDLWKLFGKKVIRLDENMTRFNDTNLIVPLAGASNPLWQGDWEDLPCGTKSTLLRKFVSKVFDFYSIPDVATTSEQPRLTFIDRREGRRLIDQDRLWNALQNRFPSVQIEILDFARMTLSEQINQIRRTDVLVGVHGAGLTHAMWLRPDATVVEILPPELGHKGFYNVVKLVGAHYLSAHGSERELADAAGDWHADDVYVEPDRFLRLMTAALSREV